MLRKNTEITAQPHFTTKDAVAKAWASQADALADFTLAHLVNRRDVYGLYEHWTDPKGGEHKVRTAPWKRERPHKQLDGHIITRHYTDPCNGRTIGLHSTSTDGTCRWLAIDIDRHSEDDPTPAKNYEAAALHWMNKVKADCLNAILEDSNGAGGSHLWIVFTKPLPAVRVFNYGQWLVSDYAEHGLRDAPEVFPKQANIGDGYGNWLRLPGRHHTRDHYSRFYDGNGWIDGPEAWLGMAFNTDVPNRAPIAPPAPTVKRTGSSDTYRGRVIDQTVEGSLNSKAIALVLTFALSEQYEAGQWFSMTPRTAEGRFWIVGRDGQINAKVAEMLASTVGWTGDITDGPQNDLNACQVVIENGVARWLRNYDEPAPLDKYIAKMPTGLHAGDHRRDYLYILAAHCTNDLGMSINATIPYLQQWNRRQAVPVDDATIQDTARNATLYSKGAA